MAKFYGETQKHVQDLYDYMCMHMFRQGKPARQGGKTVYRTDDGLTDPICALIEPDKYDKRIESMYMRDVCKEFLQITHKDVLQFLGRMQQVHDEHLPWLSSDRMAYRLNEVGSWFGLNTSVLGKYQFPDR